MKKQGSKTDKGCRASAPARVQNSGKQKKRDAEGNSQQEENLANTPSRSGSVKGNSAKSSGKRKIPSSEIPQAKRHHTSQSSQDSDLGLAEKLRAFEDGMQIVESRPTPYASLPSGKKSQCGVSDASPIQLDDEDVIVLYSQSQNPEHLEDSQHMGNDYQNHLVDDTSQSLSPKEEKLEQVRENLLESPITEGNACQPVVSLPGEPSPKAHHSTVSQGEKLERQHQTDPLKSNNGQIRAWEPPLIASPNDFQELQEDTEQPKHYLEPCHNHVTVPRRSAEQSPFDPLKDATCVTPSFCQVWSWLDTRHPRIDK